MKKKLVLAVCTIMVLGLCACGGSGKKVLHCDNCGAEVEATNKNMDEDWLIYCEECNEELGVEDRVMEIINN